MAHGIRLRLMGACVAGALLVQACSAGDEPVARLGGDSSGPSALSAARPAAGVGRIAAAGRRNAVPAVSKSPPASGVIVKFKSTGPTGVSESVQALLAHGRSFSSATLDKSSSLDGILQRHSVTKAQSLAVWRGVLDTASARAKQSARWSRFAHASRSSAALAPDLTNIYHLDVPGDVAAAVAELSQDPHVEYAQPNYVVTVSAYTPNDPYLASSGSFGQPYADLWGVLSIGSKNAWDSARGLGAIVAVVDTGVDRQHPDLSPNIWVNTHDPVNGVDDDGNGLVDDVNGWSFADDTSDVTDRYGHGTHVAGTIAAQDNNGVGVVGIAPDAKIMAVKGLGDNGAGTAFNLARAVVYAAESGADVINNSWGCGPLCVNPVGDDALKQAHSLGAVVVFAAGNDFSDTWTGSPANSPYSLTVSATTFSGTKADFSNYGPIDVGAPGSGDSNGSFTEPTRAILSLKSSICAPNICPASLLVGQDYLRQSGTSMAAPHAAGLAALIVSQHPTYSPEQIRQVMRRSADDLNADGYDVNLGYGRINAQRAMAEPAPLEALVSTPFSTVSVSPLAVTGSANGPSFASYVLEYGAGRTPSSWTTIASSSTSVKDGQLANWNLSSVGEGEQLLRVRALTTDGRSYEDRQLVVIDRVILTSPPSVALVPAAVYRGGDVVSLQGTVAMPGLTRYEFVITSARTGGAGGGSVVLTGGGTSPVQNGVLGTWSTTGVLTDFYRIKLNVYLSNGSVISEETVAIVDTRLHVGWPRTVEGVPVGNGIYSNNSSLKFADLNEDGRADLLVGYGRTLKAFQQDGTPLSTFQPAINPAKPNAFVQDTPAVGDVNGDGHPDVVVGNDMGDVLVMRANGSALPGWPKAVADLFTTNRVALADLNGDTVLDIIAADSRGTLRAYKSDGTLLPGFPVVIGTGKLSSPAVVDMNRDGSPEIVVGSGGGNLTLLSAQGAVRPGWPKAISPLFQAVGDLDGDGNLEVVASTLTNQIVAYRYDGSAVSGFPKSLNAMEINTPVLGDLNGDGKLEIFVGTQTPFTPGPFGGLLAQSILYGWDAAGNTLPGWPQISSQNFHITLAGYQGISLADVDGDGATDVVSYRQVGDFDSPLEAFHFNGSRVTGFERPNTNTGPNRSATPAIADMDGDAQFEMAWINADGLLEVWDLPSSSAGPAPWPTFAHDAKNTNALPGSFVPCTITGTCTISTVAGHGAAGSAGDGGPATSASFSQSFGVAADQQGNFYYADQYNSKVRKISASGVVTTFAGTGNFGLSGDGGPATSAQLRQPWAVKVDGAGNVYILDQVANNVRKVTPGGVISTVAGSAVGNAGSSGDGGLATNALLRQPSGLAVDTFGNLYIVDAGNAVMRMVTTQGIISTIAGTLGTPGFSGDGSIYGSRINPSASTLAGIAVDAPSSGSFTVYFNDTNNYRVRQVYRSGGYLITDTVAGTGVPGNAGDGGQARLATFTNLQGLTLDQCGNLVLSDASAQRLRKIKLGTGIISAVAGTGAGGFSGDAGPASSAAFNMPEDLAIAKDGAVLIMDRANIRVRRVAACITCAAAP